MILMGAVLLEYRTRLEKNMFRELIRKNKQITELECIEILKSEKRGVLSVNGDDGYPYGMPMNHFYNGSDGCIYFHCGKFGHRIDSLNKSSKVSFCVYEQGTASDGDWALNVRSVIVFGNAELVSDIKTIEDVTTRLSLKFTSDKEYIEKEIKEHGNRTVLIKLKPEHICGKLVKEA